MHQYFARRPLWCGLGYCSRTVAVNRKYRCSRKYRCYNRKYRCYSRDLLKPLFPNCRASFIPRPVIALLEARPIRFRVTSESLFNKYRPCPHARTRTTGALRVRQQTHTHTHTHTLHTQRAHARSQTSPPKHRCAHTQARAPHRRSRAH